MAFYWGQGVGLPMIPPAFLLHPNTLKGLILCNLGFMCYFGIAPSGKPRQISPFCFSQPHSAYYKCTKARQLRLQTGQKLSRTAKQTQREKQAESNILKASKHKKYLLLEQTKPLCSYSKPRGQNITFCWETWGMTEILFIQFLISLLRLSSFHSFICLKLLLCKTSN